MISFLLIIKPLHGMMGQRKEAASFPLKALTGTKE